MLDFSFQVFREFILLSQLKIESPDLGMSIHNHRNISHLLLLNEQVL